MRLLVVVVSLGVVLVGSTAHAQKQQVTVTAPNTSVQSDFSEQFRVGLDLNHPNFNIRFGPGGGAAGPLGGGFTPPLGGTSTRIPLRGGSLNGSLSFSAGQSSSRGITTTAPVLTTLDGTTGSVFSGTVQPFVTGLFPVVASGGPPFRSEAAPPVALSPVQSMLQRGDIQLQKDSTGTTRLVTSDPQRGRSAPAPAKSDADSSNLFRRGIEKYAGSKR